VYTLTALIAVVVLLKEPAHREKDAKIPIRRLFNRTLFRVMLIYAFAQFLGLANSQSSPHTPFASGS
jgi:hypothetical protein